MKQGFGIKVLGFVGLFLLTLFIFFPLNNLKGYIFDKVYRASGVLLISESIYISFLGIPGVGMKNVSVTLPLAEEEIELHSESVTLRPSFSGFFPPHPGLSIKISNLKKGGDIYTKIGKGGHSVSFYLDAENVNLDQVGARNGGPPISGDLNISSDINFNEADVSKSTGFFKMTASDLKINQQTLSPPDPAMAAFSFLVPAMKIGKLTGSLAMKNGILEITQFKFGEEASSDFKGNISGEFKLEKIFEQSTFNVALKLKLSQKILDNPDAKTFTSFLSSYQLAPGEYGLKWNASVKDFTNFSIKAIPEKLNN